MYSLIVLGIIPGTQFQITFLWWLMGLLTVTAAKIMLAMRRRKSLLWLRLILAFYAMTLRQPRAL